MPIRSTTSRRAAAIALIAFAAAGCSSSSRAPTAVRAVAAPRDPSTPVAAVEFLKWCWNNRDVAHYREIFSDDFGFHFAASDTAGNPFVDMAWTRDDELASAQHIFDAASSITLTIDGDLRADPDFRPGKNPTWHQQVQIANLTLTINWKDGGAFRVTGGGLFYLVRGDSATLPQELKDRGFKPDPKRWYIERWEDETNARAQPASAPGQRALALPAQPLPTKLVTWGGIKLLYR